MFLWTCSTRGVYTSFWWYVWHNTLCSKQNCTVSSNLIPRLLSYLSGTSRRETWEWGCVSSNVQTSRLGSKTKVFNTLGGVWILDETLSGVFDLYLMKNDYSWRNLKLRFFYDDWAISWAVIGQVLYGQLELPVVQTMEMTWWWHNYFIFLFLVIALFWQSAMDRDVKIHSGPDDWFSSVTLAWGNVGFFFTP